MEETILKELIRSGAPGIVILVLIRVVVYLYKRLEKLQDDHIRASQEQAKQHGEEMKTQQAKTHELLVSLRNLAGSYERRRKLPPPSGSGEE